MSSLYLCYQSVLEPLTQTQVIAYLEGLARAGYEVILLTFEPRALRPDEARDWTQRLAGKGIRWYWIRYHKRPTVPATAWDILAGIATGLRLARKHRVRLIHARSHVPAVMGMALKRLTGAKLLFDLRGFMAEEYVDAGVWAPDGRLYRATKRMEQAVVRASDGIIVLAHSAKKVLHEWYPAEAGGKPVSVIPCCVDLRHVPRPAVVERRLPGAAEPKTIAYAGKLGGSYPVEAMVAFVATAAEMIPGVRWQVWTQSDPQALRVALEAQGLGERTAIGRLPPEALLPALGRTHAGLALYRRGRSGPSCSPTKVGEYLAAGLPVICSGGIGDMDALLSGRASGANGADDAGASASPSGSAVGVVVRDLDREAYREAVPRLVELMENPGTAERCRAAAETHLDLERVGWVRYQETYRDLIGAA